MTDAQLGRVSRKLDRVSPIRTAREINDHGGDRVTIAIADTLARKPAADSKVKRTGNAPSPTGRGPGEGLKMLGGQ